MEFTTYFVEGYNPDTGERHIERHRAKDDPEKALGYASAAAAKLSERFGGPFKYTFVYGGTEMTWKKSEVPGEKGGYVVREQ